MSSAPEHRDKELMGRALELAARGQGRVEPNPMVGCVIVNDGTVVGEGWHQRYGAAHAEVEAIRAAGPATRGATMLVTLEPCCHQGKTPPCTDAILKAGIARVVVAQQDPFDQVAGRGIRRLAEAGVDVDVGVGESAARDLNAPYHKLLTHRRPWVIAKWAMTLDGKIATRTGDSKWISNEAARTIVHQIRARVDAIIVGRQTALHDDPLLTARPPGPRVPTRIVVDAKATLPSNSKLALSAKKMTTLVATGPEAPPDDCERLTQLGCGIIQLTSTEYAERFVELLDQLGGHGMTNVFVEGGGTLLGAAFDAGEVDEVHVFVAPKLVGGAEGVTVAGLGCERIELAQQLMSPVIEAIEGDVYIHGRLRKP